MTCNTLDDTMHRLMGEFDLKCFKGANNIFNALQMLLAPWSFILKVIVDLLIVKSFNISMNLFDSLNKSSPKSAAVYIFWNTWEYLNTSPPFLIFYAVSYSENLHFQPSILQNVVFLLPCPFSPSFVYTNFWPVIKVKNSGLYDFKRRSNHDSMKLEK